MVTIPVPLPPLEEQYRIVEKIEELFSALDKSKQTYDKALNLLKCYKSSMLKTAFEGKLTAKWRDTNDDLDSAEDLLLKIEVERTKQYQSELQVWLDNGKMGKRPAVLREYNIDKIELAKNKSLPVSWIWSTIGQLTYSMKNGIYRPSDSYSKEGVASLRMYNIHDGQIAWHDIKRMNISEGEIEEYLLKPGDLLVNRVNSRELVGKTARVPEYIERCVYESKNIRLRLVLNETSYYLNYWFFLSASTYFDRNVQQTAGMASLNQEQLASFPVPLAGLKEQNQIVQEIETRLTLVYNLEESIRKGIKQIQILRSAILKEAFCGKLISPGYYSKSALEILSQIKNEKERYLQEQTILNKTKPKRKKMENKLMTILEVLRDAETPLSSKEVWLKSIHKENIEEFYAELKKLELHIKEIKIGTDSLLSLNNEN